MKIRRLKVKAALKTHQNNLYLESNAAFIIKKLNIFVMTAIILITNINKQK
jgi:hypothetical protein